MRIQADFSDQVESWHQAYGFTFIITVQVNLWNMFYSEMIARQVQIWTIRIGSLWLSAEFIFMERVSLCVSQKIVFKWHDDNGVLRYSNWEDGGSDDTDLPLLDTCVVLHSITGKWENVSCTDEPENGVVCKTSKFSISGLRQLYLFSVLLCAVCFIFIQITTKFEFFLYV